VPRSILPMTAEPPLMESLRFTIFVKQEGESGKS
jgi:hypothetical protein